MSTIYTERIQKLYVAYFGRPADYDGLHYWETTVASHGGSAAIFATISAEFAASAEYQATYAGQTPYQIVDSIYLNLLNRTADLGGRAYWGDKLVAGALTIDTVVEAIVNSALTGPNAADKAVLQAKIAAAVSFTESIDTLAEVQGYAGPDAAAHAHAWLHGVTAPVTQAQVDAAVAEVVAAGNGEFDEVTLTPDPESKTANIFTAPLAWSPGGDEYLNTLQDEDELHGVGDEPTLNVTLGNNNDDDSSYDVTPELRGIEVVNIAFSNTDDTFLDLQDSGEEEGVNLGKSMLTDVNVTRISSGGSRVENMWTETVNLSAKNSNDIADMTFTYIDSELAGHQAVNLSISKVTADDLVLGSDSIQFEQIEVVNLTVVAGGASTINLVDLRPDNLPETSQRLNITANAALVIGRDADNDHGTRPAAPAVAAAACYGTPAYAGLAGHDLGFIEHNNAFTDATTASLNYISITGAGNVTLDSVGSAPAFVLEGSTSTGNIAVNISNAADDSTARFATGDGNDTVLIDSYISGYVPVSGGGTMPVYTSPDFAAGVNEISGNTGDSAQYNQALVYGLVTGKGDDVVISYNDVAITGAISTGDGNDFVSVGELLGSVGAPIIKDYVGATVNLGDGNNWINALNLGEEARIMSGSGNDVINLTTVVNGGSGKTVIHADSAGLDADNGAEVNTGAGNDLVNFTFTGAALNDLVSFGADNYTFTPGYSVIEGLVNGGEGIADEVRVTGNKDLDLVLGNSADAPRVTNVEVLTLNSTTAYDATFKANFEAGNGYRTISVNDNNAETADYRVNVNEFDSSLQTINLNHCDGVIRNTYPEIAGYKAFAGDDATDTLFNLRGTETIHVRALETDLFDPHFYNKAIGLATSVSAANDELGTVYSAGASATSWAAAFNTDLNVNLRLQTNSIATDVAHVVLEDVATLSDPANAPFDPLDVNYDVTINDISNGDASVPGGSVGTDAYESLDLTVNGADNHGVNLMNDFDVALTVTGADTKGGNLTIINVDAASINTTGYQGNVYLGVESIYNHTIITGIGNDIIRLGDQTAIALGNDSVDAGEGNDIVVFNGTGTTSVNHAGLDNLDTVKGGAGNDILAFGGQTSYTPGGFEIGVTLGASEWQNVTGFETIQLSAGQATPDSYYNDVYVGNDPHGTSTWTGGFDVWVESGDYYLNITNNLIDANGGDVLHIVNNNVDDSRVLKDHNNGVVSLNGATEPDTRLIQLGPVSEGNTTLNLLGLNTSNQITYDGAIGLGGSYVSDLADDLLVDHGSNDRFIFTDVNLEGLDTIDGGALDANGVSTWCGNGDVLEIRHLSIDGNAPEVVGADLANISNVGTIVFNNDTVGEQTLILGGFTDALVDNLVDSLHTATSAQSETLYIVAQDGSLPFSSAGYGSAVLHLDASGLTTGSSNLDITLDTHLSVLVDTYDWTASGGSGGGSGLFSSYFLPDKTGYDIITTGEGDDTIHGVSSADQVNGLGGIDTVNFTTDFADWYGNSQLQSIEHYVTDNNANIMLWYQTENLDIIIGNGGNTNNNQVIGGFGTDTLTFTDNYADDAEYTFTDTVLNDKLIQRIENLVVDGRMYGVAVDGAVDGEGNVCTTIGAAGADGVTHFPHELITIADRTITVNISDQTEAFNITLTDNVSGGGDILISGQGADTITGGTGSDSITGGLGADAITITSGGNDHVYLTTLTSSDTITGFGTGDVLELGALTSAVSLVYGEVQVSNDIVTDANVIVFGNVPGGIGAAATVVAGDASVSAHDGFILLATGASTTEVWYSTDLGNDGTETLVATLVGIPNPQVALSAANFAV